MCESTLFIDVPFSEGSQERIYPNLSGKPLVSTISYNKDLIYRRWVSNQGGCMCRFRRLQSQVRLREKLEDELVSLSITNPLTDLHNRKGFISLAGQQLKLSDRNKRAVQRYFTGLDGLKWITDTLGHEEGDKALIETATIFKKTFRTSDIIARLGGDEYATRAVDITEENSYIFTARLQSLIDARNNQENRRYRLSISVGCTYYDPEHPCSLDKLMAHADQLMYEQKQNKKGLLLQGDYLASSNPYPAVHNESKDSLVDSRSAACHFSFDHSCALRVESFYTITSPIKHDCNK
ncbi:MAG: GGDEF domain-containing protein [Syntrophales bacterium]